MASSTPSTQDTWGRTKTLARRAVSALALCLFACSDPSAAARDAAVETLADAPAIDSAADDAVPITSCVGGMLRGVTVSGWDDRAIVDAIGAEHVHFWMSWRAAQPKLSAPYLAPADVDEAAVAAFADGSAGGVDWSQSDAHVAEYRGKTMVVGLGSGWVNNMPDVAGKRITPDSIGREAYLGQLSLYARAAARRYRGKIAGWQIENEPNVAAETIAFGWRAGDAWTDRAFVRRVLETLRDAVRKEDPSAFITINFHSDIHYEADIEQWRDLVDRIGIDAYPNYVLGKPLQAARVAERVRRARAVAQGKPVIVMETGYPSAPTANGYSEANQARYIDDVFARARDAGACALYWFKLTSKEDAGTATPPQENYWGLVRADGTKKAGWEALERALKVSP